MSTKLPTDLWRTIYGIQGDAQQAAEGDRPCRSIEDTWAKLEKVLPPPYAAAPDLLKALKRIEHDWDGEPEDMQEARAAIRRAEPSTGEGG